jgi:hypothetical protein
MFPELSQTYQALPHNNSGRAYYYEESVIVETEIWTVS